MKVDMKLITKLTLLSLVFVGAMGVSSVTASAQAKTPKKKATLTRKAKDNISIETARKTALRHESGTVESEKLETLKGRPVYAFEIRNKKGSTDEILINARSGRMIRKSRERAAVEPQGKMAYTKKKAKG
jgi:uncharacterized membrane protein YkoI